MNPVRNGTPQHGVNLCESCTNYRVRYGLRQGDMDAECDAFGRGQVLRYPVSRCSQYSDEATSQSQLFYKTAWVLVPHAERGLSAIPPDEYRQRRYKGEIE